MTKVENVIIIGSGPAGQTAAIYSARANLEPLLFEGFFQGGLPGGQLMTTTEVENYPGFPQGISGPELMTALRKQAERFGTRFITQDVSEVDLSSRPFVLRSENQVYHTRSLIVATGATASYLGLDSEKRLLNRGVSACATCDGALPIFRNQKLLVVGGGDSAMEEANYLTRFASLVYIVHRRDQFRASKFMVARSKKNPKIEFLFDTVLQDILGDEEVKGVTLHNIKTGKTWEQTVAGVFIAIGHKPNTEIFRGQLACDETGYIVTQEKSTHTSIDGVFACGDVQDNIYRQAISAAGSGCQAAIDAERWLENQFE